MCKVYLSFYQIKGFFYKFTCFFFFFLLPQLIIAQNEDSSIKKNFDDMSLVELMNVEIVTVSRLIQKISEAPGFVTVISKKEIENSGARTILDILRLVPGFSSTINQFGLNEIEFRGFRSTNSSNIIFLMNGLSINNNVFGGATRIFDDMSVNNIKRVEILRGPGSAVYGSNAMLCVVNIITFQATEIENLNLKFRYASFNTAEFSAIYGTELLNELHFTAAFNILKTYGPKLMIPTDRLSGESYTLAPRSTDYSNFKIDTQLSISYKGWNFNSLYVDKNRGPFIGPSFALVEKDEFKNRGKYFLADVSKKMAFSEKFVVKSRLYYKRMYFSPDGQLYPPGFGYYDEEDNPLDINDDGILDIFSNGMVSKYELNDNLFGLELINELRFHQKHVLSIGFITEYSWLSDIKTNANFNIIVPGQPFYLGKFRIFDEGIVEPYRRLSISLFAQNIWKITKNASLTAGLHVDYYDDFGFSFNPRIGWVHNIFKNFLTYKLLYGHAFRAPSFGELARSNNANIIGNPNLKPETLDSYEAGVICNFNKYLQLEINFFHINLINRINRKSRGEVPDGHAALIYENDDQIISKGIETQLSAKFGESFSGFINLTYQDSRTILPVGESFQTPMIPVIKSNFMLNYKMNNMVNANIIVNYIGKRIRDVNDQREDVKAYFWSAFTIKLTNIIDKVILDFSIYNFFDSTYVDNGHLRFTPEDYPRPGLNYSIKFSYNF